MALEAAFREMGGRMRALHEILSALHTTIVEDRPAHDDVVLVDLLGDTNDDLLGWLQEAISAADAGHRVTAHPTDLYRAAQQLIICQRQFNRVARELAFDLLSYRRIAELRRFGRQRGGEWHAWARDVNAALDRCPQPISEVGDALLRCWQELADRMGVTSLLVHQLNIGQQLMVPAATHSDYTSPAKPDESLPASPASLPEPWEAPPVPHESRRLP
jgi:hypothetical protein